ncbi:hypothetical protein P153DRAFT_434893 [Dothidotthia symphoricarpi CBS 119687]|uniref:DH domain-containing protein n=1 Tax=Dothidotthia symphoricarpi CBS 119687 TaxID=1392245 RepID=A0A6A6A227_9PLEO|nr:uncharacterized protein P153DRAFT_434893 [Dothidotthia symphoricarpi CBS 119687]KAF2124631.1 hypothetical protein P153DRAFT_434893 [Dothidotthia symphoricarpi CBS 119687]
MPASPLPTDPDDSAAPKKHGSPGKKTGAAGKQNNMDGKDFAKAIGINKPANVRDKIKRWQHTVEPDEGGVDKAGTDKTGADKAGADKAVASALNTLARPASSPKLQSTTPKAKLFDDKPNWKPAHKAAKSVDASPERPKTAKQASLIANPLDDDVLTATAPKKRVISDSHWRAKPAAPKDTGRPLPKTIPNAWVRPSKIVKLDKPENEEPPKEQPKAPPPVALKPLVTYIGRSTGQTKPPPKPRIPPKPPSLTKQERPSSSGSSNAKDGKSENSALAPPSPQPEKEKTEMVKMRRSRRRPQTSHLASKSADDVSMFKHQARRSDTSLSDDAQNIITVEYDESHVTSPPASQITSPREGRITSPRDSQITSPRDDELRERRRRRRPKSMGDRTADEALRDSPSNARRRRRRSSPKTDGEELARRSPEPRTHSPEPRKPSPQPGRRSPQSGRRSPQQGRRSPQPFKHSPVPARRSPEPAKLATPPSKPVGSRLEAWLSGTSDPFSDSDSHRRIRSKDSTSTIEIPPKNPAGPPRRRRSKESVSTVEPPPKEDASEVTVSTEVTNETEEDVQPPTRHSSGSSGKRRRRRRRSREIKVETPIVDDASTVMSDDTAETPAPEAPTEVSLSPTPTLKRRGARRSRSQHSIKSRSMSSPLRETTSVDEAFDEGLREAGAASPAPSSSVDASAIDIENIALRPRPLDVKRFFPTGGKRLSTIASVESFAASQRAPPSEAVGSEAPYSVSNFSEILSQVAASQLKASMNPETSTLLSRKSTRRNRLASHADLISVLSMPKTGAKSIVSARSIRTNRSRMATATIPDIMRELTSDEGKYMRELRTIVDGVIPVLLSCVLSKSDSAVAAGLFSRSANTDPNDVTKPIIEMGVCLERMKTLHKRIPTDDPDAFVDWAQSAQDAYAAYISSWRLGFQDVVVSLAPADDDPFKPAKIVNGPEDGAPWDEGMPRNAEGYVVNGDGERVDVAYILKRPLVRLKYLSKSLKSINHVRPSERAEKIASIFQELVTAARRRSNDEYARLEDEAAANIDPTRTRDPRSLAPLAGVRVEPARCVRARDHFDMHLYHSSGQEISCRVEILLRDNTPGTGKGGDLLFCEVDPAGRWLLLPPVQQNRVSARNGDMKGEIVVMIRGHQADGSEWSEVMSLTIDDEQAGFEWVQMLGLNPIPPPLSDVRRTHVPGHDASAAFITASPRSTSPHQSRTPSPHEIDIPIGEQHTEVSKVWRSNTPDRRQQSRTVSPTTPPGVDTSLDSGTYDTSATTPGEDGRSTSPWDDDPDRTPRSLNEALRIADNGSPTGLRRTKATRLSRHGTSSPVSSKSSRQITLDDPQEFVEEPMSIEEEVKPRRKSTKRRPQSLPSGGSSTVSQSNKKYSVWMPESDVGDSDESEEDTQSVGDQTLSPPGSPPLLARPSMHRRVSSVPSLELPSIPRQRKSSRPSSPVDEPEPEPERILEPAFTTPKSKKKSKLANEILQDEEDDGPPPVPVHRSPSPATPVTLKGTKTPVLTPALPAFKNKRRSSSPLKHEYEPSTCTESSSESEEEVVSEVDASEEDEESLTSESSDDELEDDVPMPLMPSGYPGLHGYVSRPCPPNRRTTTFDEPEPKPFAKVSPPSSINNTPADTITPSQSASNTPYRSVPHDSGKATKSVGSIFTWSDEGRWDSLHPDECNIVVTPGKVEVFELKSDGHETGRAPLIAVELTPLVPLRKSTAIDISIRSPPTSDSRIQTGNNIMLRSRNATECTQLYALINQARINNPTYLALQNARGPYGQTSWAEAMDRQNAARTNPSTSSGWLNNTLGRRNSYRKTTTRAASISAATESSVGTMNTALRSALGRFSFGKNGMFSVRNSTLGSRSSGSFDSAERPGSGASTPPGSTGAPAGITNTKCRLYERESLKKWRDMGSARLTIMLPSPHPSVPSSPNSLQRAPGTRDHTQERRILVTGKMKGEVLLDVTLSETCFERVARSGIAVSVWEDTVGDDGEVGRVGKTGGVSGARARVYMIQMKSERECAHCFGLLGRLRY